LVSNESGHARIDWKNLSVDALLDECIRGRQGAWKEFLRRFGPLVRGTIVQKLASLAHADATTDADDIFQEVFKDLIEHECRALYSIRDRNKTQSWLCAVALHKTVDFIRRKWRNAKSAEGHGYIAEQEAEYSPSSGENAELAEEVQNAVRRLRPDEQLLVKWYYIHGLKYREMAALANVPINTVSTRMFRIKKKLSKRLGKRTLD